MRLHSAYTLATLPNVSAKLSTAVSILPDAFGLKKSTLKLGFAEIVNFTIMMNQQKCCLFPPIIIMDLDVEAFITLSTEHSGSATNSIKPELCVACFRLL